MVLVSLMDTAGRRGRMLLTRTVVHNTISVKIWTQRADVDSAEEKAEIVETHPKFAVQLLLQTKGLSHVLWNQVPLVTPAIVQNLLQNMFVGILQFVLWSSAKII